MNTTKPARTKEGFAMGRSSRWMLFGLSLAALLFAACAQGEVAGIVSEEAPVKVEKNEATGISRLTLSAKAAERLGIATGAVSAAGAGTAIPYAALVYDKAGKTWVYTNPQGRDFVRQEIEVERIEGDLAFLSSGPPVGTAVVTVGTAELWGVDTGVGGGH
jgi:hypothetical protein